MARIPGLDELGRPALVVFVGEAAHLHRGAVGYTQAQHTVADLKHQDQNNKGEKDQIYYSHIGEMN